MKHYESNRYGLSLRPFLTRGAMVLAVATSLLATNARADIGLLNALQQLTTMHGAGAVKSETRPIKDFDMISLRGPMDLNIAIGKDFIVTVQSEESLLPVITTRVQDGRLVIDSSSPYFTKITPKVNVQLPALHQLSVQGSGDAKLAGVTTGALRMVVSGSGNVVAAGTVDSLNIDIDGSGDVDSSLLVASKAYVRINGSGDVHVYAQDSLDVVINGSGDVSYLGGPHSFTKSVNGSGDVHPQ